MKAADQLIAPFARALPRSTSANRLILCSLKNKYKIPLKDLPTHFLIEGFVINGNRETDNYYSQYLQSWE